MKRYIYKIQTINISDEEYKKYRNGSNQYVDFVYGNKKKKTIY